MAQCGRQQGEVQREAQEEQQAEDQLSLLCPSLPLLACDLLLAEACFHWECGRQLALNNRCREWEERVVEGRNPERSDHQRERVEEVEAELESFRPQRRRHSCLVLV
jgi:hypothetical protein